VVGVLVLLNRAKEENRPFNELLQYYAMERFLYRLSRSRHADRFVLKGAPLLPIWGDPTRRATKDIDLLGRVAASVDNLVAIARECLAFEVEDDGIHFDERTVTGEDTRIQAEYDGIRLRFEGALGNAKVSLQVDVGFGDLRGRADRGHVRHEDAVLSRLGSIRRKVEGPRVA
jgi:hypothetical protein